MSAGPLRESAIRVLIEAHLAEDNVIEARRVYQLYSCTVQRELGIEPGQQLADLVPGMIESRNRLRADMSAGWSERMTVGHS